MTVERFPVEGGHILMFARAIGELNPAYYGALTGTSSAVPPTFPWAAEHFDPDSVVRPRPGVPWLGSGATDSGIDASAGGGLHAEQRYEYHRPLREGDVLTAVHRPGRSWTKEGRRGGRLAFSERITEYRDQDGQLVVTAVMVSVLTERVAEEGA